MAKRGLWCMTPMVLAGLGALAGAAPMDLVRDGRVVAKIVVRPEGKRSGGRDKVGDRLAGRTLVEWVRKITGAKLPVVEAAAAGEPAIYVGAAAVAAGLTLPEESGETNEALRVVCDGRRVLLAGQCPSATVKAACRLLEELGCRYFMDHPLGEVYPRARTLTVRAMDVRESPGLRLRSIWGSRWTSRSLWKIWNGQGGERFDMRHAWGQYVSGEAFDKHPEYFALRDGRRRKGSWYCTSNPGLRKVFADGVIAAIARGNVNPSISPPDGRGYCQCPACRGQDDPNVIEPSSGHVSVSNRYLDFYDAVARRVAEVHPRSILNFYAYADYTQAPTGSRRLAENLCVWVAPIRYSRHHRIGSENSSSRTQLARLLDGWSAAVGKMGYRTYNYNLAECTVPYSKLAIWKHDIPYLKRKGCIGINLETLHSWHIYGPHIYQSIRLAYDPAADPDALMDDYFARFFGPKAGPPMKAYWQAIDEAFAAVKAHAGSFFAIHRVYTPQLIARCRALLDQAAAAAKGDERYAARVAMNDQGFQNAVQYIELRAAMNRGDFARAKAVCDAMLERNERLVKQRLSNHYTPRYIRRFLSKIVDAGAQATAPPAKVLTVLPDRWRMGYDDADEGEAKGFHKPDFADAAWREVATYSDTLDAQGLPDRKTILWYRTRLDIPKRDGKLALFLAEVDGAATVFVNGTKVGEQPKKRRPFECDISQAVRVGENVVAVRCDHRKISELFLGGILRPVLLISRPSGR